MDDSYPADKPRLCDGATGTYFAQLGYNYEDSLEQWILHNPRQLEELQKCFVEAGSEIILTPTFTANPAMLKRFDLDEKCEEINQKLAILTRENVSEKALVAGNIGPTNIAVEPYGETSFTELITMYRRQAEALEPYVDMYWIETVTSLSDMRAAVIACRDSEKPVYLTISINEDLVTYNNEVSPKAALVLLQELRVDAFGINCTPASRIKEVMAELLPCAKIPLIAKPCCDVYDENGNCTRVSPEDFARDIAELLEMGVQIVGGCCGATAEHIKALKGVMPQYKAFDGEKEQTDFIFMNETQIFYLEPDTTEISEPISCYPEMHEEVSDMCGKNYDILLVEINSPDDAFDFAKSAHMATLPVMFFSENELALKMALMMYQGRALVDSKSEIDEEVLKEIADKYGAVVY